MGCVFYPGGIPDYSRFSKADAPFAIPHKAKSKGALTAKAAVEQDGTRPLKRPFAFVL